jgi:ribulose-phosphate 3-epimerase
MLNDMSVITPTITTEDPHEYREQIEQIADYAEGVHIDFSDGVFSPRTLLPPKLAWRDERLVTHVHLMYQQPLMIVDDIIQLEPDLVIVHAESIDARRTLEAFRREGVRTGIALLSETNESVLKAEDLATLADHILFFGGHLGFQGGVADLKLLEKVARTKIMFPDYEIGWDGGVNDETAPLIAQAGVSVLNTGMYLKQSKDPKKAYDKLTALVQSY